MREREKERREREQDTVAENFLKKYPPIRLVLGEIQYTHTGVKATYIKLSFHSKNDSQ